MKRLTTLVTMCFSFIVSFAQHEFFIRDITVSVKNNSEIDGIPSNTPTVYIRGSLENDSGYLVDSGEIQITGNITFTNYAVLKDSGEFVFIGAQFGTTSSFNSYVQIINGNFTDAFVGGNAFHTIIIDKPNWTTMNNSRIRLGQNVEISKSLLWKSGGIITTDLVSHADIGEDYQYEIYLKNPDPNSFSGYATTSGATNNYVVGKLRRQVDRIGDYYIPIGVEPDHSIGGMNACKISFTSTPTNAGILAYLQKNGLQPILNPVLYGDIGTDPGTVGGDFFTCIGGPDGILDRMIISKNQNYQWNVTPNTVGTFLYTIEVIPTTACENSGTGENVPSSCNTPYAGRSMTWLAHNGVPLGTPTTLVNPVPLFSGLGYAVVPPPNYKIITDQVGFSTFRLHGVELLNTVLPIELISFSLSPIDNEYFALQWQTASEINNDYFILERSLDGTSFTAIATINGNGTSSQSHSYNYDDYNVTTNKIYYYRLKQVDYDGSYTYSDIIYGKLSSTLVVALLPNPTTELVQSTVQFDRAEVLTELGHIVKTTSSSNTVNMTDLASALYHVKLYIGNTSYNFKIVKK